MGLRYDSLLDRLLHRRVLNRWRRASEQAAASDAEDLRRMGSKARQLRRALDQVIHVADARLTLPMIGMDSIRKPWGTDWAWRPEVWRGRIAVPGQATIPARAVVVDGTTIYHDCRRSELTFRQIRNTREADLAPFGFRLDVFRFDGSYLSLAIDLPAEAAQGLRLTHLLQIETLVEIEKPLEIFARLNIKHGPNVEQLVREFPVGAEAVMVEFDLAYTKIDDRRVERIWIDLIFEVPEMNQIILRDVTITRRPRAEL
jgi:hypothetical protein